MLATAGSAGLISLGLYLAMPTLPDLRAVVETWGQRHLGRALVVAGEPQLHLLPTPRILIPEIRLPDAEGFGREPLLRIQQVSIRVSLTGLLRHALVLHRVRLIGVDAHLVLDSQGGGNLDALFAAMDRQARGRSVPEAPVGVVPGSETDPPPPSPMEDWSPRLMSLGIEDLTLRVENRQSGQRLVIHDARLETGGFESADPLRVQIAGQMNGERPRLQTDFTLDLTAAIPDATDPILLTSLRLTLARLDSPWVRGDLDLRGTMDARPSQGIYRLDGTRLTGTLVLPAADGESRGAVDPVPLPVRLRTNLVLSVAEETLAARPLDLAFGDLELGGALTASQLFSSPSVSGRLSLGQLDPARWMEQVGLLEPGAPVSGLPRSLSAGALIALSPDHLKLTELELMLDAKPFSGSATLLRPPVRGGAVGVRFDLLGRGLNLNRYLAAAMASSLDADPQAASSTTTGPSPMESGNRASPFQPPLSLKALRGLDLEGRLGIGELRAGFTDLGASRIVVHARDGILSASLTSGAFYGGSLGAELLVDAWADPPRSHLRQQFSRLSLDALNRDLAAAHGLDARMALPRTIGISGSADGELCLWGEGSNLQALLQGLHGNGTLIVRQGTVDGLNLMDEIARVRARLDPGRTAGDPDLPTGPVGTRFDALRLAGNLTEGQIDLVSMALRAPDFDVTGGGRMGLWNHALALDLSVGVTDPAATLGIGEPGHTRIPVQLTGTWAAPRWRMDLTQLVRAVEREQSVEPGNSLIDRLEQSTGIRGLGRGLRDLFGR